MAVTQNFVNPKNFEFVCLDLAPGYHHKGVCRAGLLALNDGPSMEAEIVDLCRKDDIGYSGLTRKEKRMKIQKEDDLPQAGITNELSQDSDVQKRDFTYDIDFLATLLDRDKDHYNAPWSSGNCIGPREMREWLFRLWVGKPGMRELIWKVWEFLIYVNFFCLDNLLVGIVKNYPTVTDSLSAYLNVSKLGREINRILAT